MRSRDGHSKLKQTRILLSAILILAARSWAQEAAAARPQRYVLVSIPARKLAVLENDTVLRVFEVAVGAHVSPSPNGQFQIINRVSHPTYYHAGQVIPPGKDNPVGTRWIGLNRKGYGIHGTNLPNSIGKAASHGCIRLRNRDMEQLFQMLRTGDSVEIRAEIDNETAAIFGREAPEGVVAQVSVSMAGGSQ